jgi:hypothetical protein
VDPVSGLLKLHGPLMVDLEGGTIAVVGVSIGFDDHPLLGLEEVDEEPRDQDVDLRERNVENATESEEIDLER